MKKFFYLAILAVCLGGCSSPPAANDGSANVRTNVDISELNNPPANSISDANNMIQSNTFYDANGNPLNPKKGGGNANAAPMANAKPMTYPASDNSEIISGTNNRGQMFETRTFKNNPVLARIEKIYVEMDKPTITAYLKNGQKVDLTTIKMNDPMQISAQDIIDAISPRKEPAAVPTKQPSS